MSTVPEVLHRYDVGLSESDVAADLDRALQGLPGAGSAPLTDAEIAYLAGHAGDVAGQTVARWDAESERERRGVVAAAGVEQVIATTLSIEQAARRLGVDRTRISHRLSAGALYVVTVGSRRRIPTWQFNDRTELPGLGLVVAAIQPGAHPLDVAALMTTPQDELLGRTPVEHLASGGEPSTVAELMADLGRW